MKEPASKNKRGHGKRRNWMLTSDIDIHRNVHVCAFQHSMHMCYWENLHSFSLLASSMEVWILECARKTIGHINFILAATSKRETEKRERVKPFQPKFHIVLESANLLPFWWAPGFFQSLLHYLSDYKHMALCLAFLCWSWGSNSCLYDFKTTTLQLSNLAGTHLVSLNNIDVVLNPYMLQNLTVSFAMG